MKYNEYKNLDYAKVGADILAYWKENNIFEQSVETRRGHQPFVFYEGPPSANGTPGIHHVMARAIKDIFCRYKTLKGFQVNSKGGWDTHGLPVELGVDISVQPTLLRARVSAFYAKPPFGPMEPGTPDDDSESGRGLALIQALVTTVTFERQDGTNTWVLTRTSQD